jgi:hypothetical protein
VTARGKQLHDWVSARAGGSAKVRQERAKGVCGALPSALATWAGRADVGAAVAEEEDRSDGQGPRDSESERPNGRTG